MLLFGFLLLSSLLLAGETMQAVSVDDGVCVITCNANYTFPAGGMNFSKIRINSSWVCFNTTYINITSPGQINITLSYLNNDLLTPVTSETLMTFTANTSSGTVWFNLTGFKGSSTYTLYRDAAEVATSNSNTEGNLSFSIAVWSEHTFGVTFGSYVGTRQVKK